MNKNQKEISDEKIRQLMELNKDRSEALKKILKSMGNKIDGSKKKK